VAFIDMRQPQPVEVERDAPSNPQLTVELPSMVIVIFCLCWVVAVAGICKVRRGDPVPSNANRTLVRLTDKCDDAFPTPSKFYGSNSFITFNTATPPLQKHAGALSGGNVPIAGGQINVLALADDVRLGTIISWGNDDFNQECQCDATECPTQVSAGTPSCAAGQFRIGKIGGGAFCVAVEAASGGMVADGILLVGPGSNATVKSVTIDGEKFTDGTVEIDNGNLVAIAVGRLPLKRSSLSSDDAADPGLFWVACGPMVILSVADGKHAFTGSQATVSVGTLSNSNTANPSPSQATASRTMPMLFLWLSLSLALVL
jgi:hypothetical protein